MQAVVETEEYLKDVKKLGLTEDEQDAIIDFIARNPAAGDEIAGTGGARKVRFAAKGKGKSGGVRIITFYSGADIPLFLLNIFAKNEKTTLTQSEKNAFKKGATRLIDAYEKKRRH